MHQPDRIVGRDLVQIGSQKVALLSQLSFVPSGSHQPFAGLQRGDPLANLPHCVADSLNVAQYDTINLVDAALGEMAMRVDQAGRRGEAVEIDYTSRRAGPATNISGGPRSDNLALGYSD